METLEISSDVDTLRLRVTRALEEAFYIPGRDISVSIARRRRGGFLRRAKHDNRRKAGGFFAETQMDNRKRAVGRGSKIPKSPPQPALYLYINTWGGGRGQPFHFTRTHYFGRDRSSIASSRAGIVAFLADSATENHHKLFLNATGIHSICNEEVQQGLFV